LRNKPLHGIRVLDLTRLLPGPVATLHLADLGADIIKIEDTGAGDYARVMGHVRDGMTDMFRMVNRNKRALALNLKHPRGRDIFLELARGADVIVEGFRPGVVNRLGIDYAAAAAINPRIVYCAISGYGQTGPYRERAGHDINYIGYAGVGDQIGAAGGPPVLANFQIADLLGGSLTPVMGILAAVIDAKTSGLGRYVDVAMTDAVLAHAVISLTGVTTNGAASGRGSDRLSGGLPCYNVYRTQDDRYLAVGALEKKFWETLCDTVQRPDLKTSHIVFGEEAQAAKDALATIFATKPQQEWAKIFADADCCVSPILPMQEAIANEQLRARGMIVNASTATGSVTQFAPPLQMSEFEFAVERQAPRQGEHSDEILREAGYSSEDIAQFRSAGVI
jgi:crotonobetainyl-CoA:carnitine CoA-transferase CaiB-like acyl-CoA transferase